MIELQRHAELSGCNTPKQYPFVVAVSATPPWWWFFPVEPFERDSNSASPLK
jgi:hypothetical protein